MDSGPRPRLMFVLGMSAQKIGGMEKFLRYFTRVIDSKGWDTVLCLEEPIADHCREYLALPSVIIEGLNGQDDLGTSGAPHLMRLLARHRPQVFVYAFNGVMRVFPWLARLFGTGRIFFNDHSSRPMGIVVKQMSFPKRMVGRVLTAPITGVISVCEFVKRSAITTGLVVAPNVVVWNGVELALPNPGRGLEFREKHGIPRDAFVFVMSVWMVEVKGVDVLLHAAADIIPSNPRVWLLLVGDGPKTNEYRQLAADLGISEQVVFPGLVSDPVGSGVFDAANVSCQPSLWQEANPLAVLEAMSMELPVIASDIGGLPEIVKDCETGFLFPPGDPKTLRERMTQLVGDPELCRNMGKAARARILEFHNIEKVAARYADILIG